MSTIKNDLGLTLTKKQTAYFEAISWLVSDERASGRTTLLALAFIDKAIKNAGQYIDVFDHFASCPEAIGKRNMLNAITNILEKTPRIFQHVTINHSQLKFKIGK